MEQAGADRTGVQSGLDFHQGKTGSSGLHGSGAGYFALLLGKWFGARTIWIDSMANIEDLSMSGARVGRYADLWLTQWPHLAKSEGPHYAGGVL